MSESFSTILHSPTDENGNPWIMPPVKANPIKSNDYDLPDNDLAPTNEDDDQDDSITIKHKDMMPSANPYRGLSEAYKMGYTND